MFEILKAANSVESLRDGSITYNELESIYDAGNAPTDLAGIQGGFEGY